MKKEIPYLHLIRTVACLMVVCLHTLPEATSVSNGIDQYFYRFILFLTRPCVPLFFMISGILLFPMEGDIIQFYKKRLSKIIYPLLVWGVVYAILPYLMNLETLKEAIIQCIRLPMTMPRHFGGILWFIYVLIGIYLIIPFVNQKIFSGESRKYLRIYLLLWLLASGADWMHCYESMILGATSISTYHLFTYFSGYLGYFILGHYLHRYPVELNKRNILILILLFIIPCLFLWRRSSITYSYIMGFLSIGSIILTFISFVLLSKISIKIEFINNVIRNISKLSFGIYLSHILVFNVLTIYLYKYSTTFYMQIFVMLLTFIGAYILTYLLSKVPFSKFVIG